jgi:hypothetical protein
MDSDLHDMIAKLWADARPRLGARVESLEAVVARPHDDAARSRALLDAHTLIGTLGSFGRMDASNAARAAEQALETRDDEALREAVSALRNAF